MKTKVKLLCPMKPEVMFWMTREEPRGKIRWLLNLCNYINVDDHDHGGSFDDHDHNCGDDCVFTSLRQFLLEPLNPITCF